MTHDILYGTETLNALSNFALDASTVRRELIDAVVVVKKAAALTRKELQLTDVNVENAIIDACDDLLSGNIDMTTSFPTHPLQGGAGTSLHMNVNEVIAALATRRAGVPVLPLDDVNKGQSTNDVCPTALRIAAIRLVRKLADACAALQESLQKKENEYADIMKLGRTELMDALPISLGAEFGAYAQAIGRDRWRIYKTEERLRQINLGGTAIGTGTNADRRYAYKVADVLRDLTGIGIAHAEYPIDLTQNNDVFVEVSGLLKALAVNLMKIATDLRLMNSGPAGGLGEITLQKVQAGSTIMPGKVNPVMAEMITQVAIRVMSDDMAVTTAAACGNFELNAFFPLIADSLLDSLTLLTNGVTLFKTKCIDTLKANPDACRKHLEASCVLVTALSGVLGYKKAADLVEKANGKPENIRSLVLAERLLDEQTLDRLLNYRHEMTYTETK